MKLQGILVLTAALMTAPLASHADSAPFGVASAYNLFATTGNISDNADIGGRIAAAGQVTGNIVVMSTLNADPYGAGVQWAIIAQGGITGSGVVNDHGHVGDIYSPNGAASFSINNPGDGSVITSGGFGFSFSDVATALDNQTAFLGALGTTGTILGFDRNLPGGGQLGVNPQNYVLYGTNAGLNVFTLTPAEYAAMGSHPIDIEIPNGATAIINVVGACHPPSVTTNCTVTLDPGGTVLLNGQQHHGDDSATNKVLFNVPNATTVNISNGFSASVLAPYATLYTGQQIAGTFIFGAIGSTGEVHNIAFVGSLPVPPTPAVPEPGTLALAGTGLLAVAGAVRRKRK